jgi:hypothetical protein
VGTPNGSLTLRRKRQERSRGMTAVYTVMVSMVVLLLLQFLLLMVAVDGYLGGRRALLVPSCLGSGACCVTACWLIGQASRRRAQGRPPPNTSVGD